MDRCPHCNKVPYPALDEAGKPIWKNILRVDILTLILVLGIVSLLFGVKLINEQCYEIVEDPCKYTHDEYGMDKCIQGYYNQEVRNVSFPQAYPTGDSAESDS